jgi:hypothetical protein
MTDYYEIIDVIKDSDNIEYINLVKRYLGKYDILLCNHKVFNERLGITYLIRNYNYTIEELINFKWIHNYLTYGECYNVKRIMYIDEDNKLDFIDSYNHKLNVMSDYEWNMVEFYSTKYPERQIPIFSNLVLTIEGYIYKNMIIKNRIPYIYNRYDELNELYDEQMISSNVTDDSKKLCEKRCEKLMKIFYDK